VRVGAPPYRLIKHRRITWRQSQELCRILNERCSGQLQIEGVQYECTLPTETQWEYACRAGTDTDVCFGEGVGSYRERIQRGEYLSQDELIWYTDNCNDDAPRDPHQGIPNPFGLQECDGNVWEWCQDRWDHIANRRSHSGVEEVQALELSELLGNHEDKSDFGEYRLRRGGSFINDGCFQRKPPNRETYHGARKRAPWWFTRSVAWAV
jgi:formylglycine-generating enzyme required for sulfatase activity